MTKTYVEKAHMERRYKFFTHVPPFSKDEVERVFRLAHVIHPDRKTAARLTLQVMRDFPVVWKATESLIPYREANLQAFLFAVSERLEMDQESDSDPSKRRYRENNYHPTPEDMLVRYINHLVSIAIRNGTFRATVGLGYHLYRHAPLVHLEEFVGRTIPSSLIPNYPDTWRTLEECIRKVDGHVTSSLKKRFSTTLDTIMWQVMSPQMAESISNTLKNLKPWGMDCPKWSRNTSILDLLTESSVGDAKNQDLERTFVHVLIDTECGGFYRLIQDYNNKYESVSAWDVRSPVFPGATPIGPNGGDLDRFNPDPLSETEVHLILDSCVGAQLYREQFRPSVLEVCVDGEKLLEFTPVERPTSSFRVSAAASYLEVYGQAPEGPCLLAAFPLCNLRDGHILHLRLAGGQRLRLSVNTSETTEQFNIQLSYRDAALLPTAVLLRRFNDWWQGFTSWSRARWVPVGSTVIVLLLLFSSLWLEKIGFDRLGEVERGMESQTSLVHFSLKFNKQATEKAKQNLVERIDGKIVDRSTEEGVQIMIVESAAPLEDVMRILALAKEEHILEEYEHRDQP